MARGQKKTIETKITEKEEIIAALRVRLKTEQSELEGLLKEKRERELEGLNRLIQDSGLKLDEVSHMLAEYLQSRNEQQTA